MKTLTSELQALLATEKFHTADLYTITRVTGAVERYASGDMAITHGGNSYSVSSLLIERSGISWRIGVDVDSMDLTIYPPSGSTFLASIVRGDYDGSTVTLERVFMETYGTVVGSVQLFTGRVAEAEADRGKASIRVNSPLELLNNPFPRLLYTPGCNVQLYSTACGVTRASYTHSGTVAAGTTTTSVVVSGVAQANGYFNQGYLTLESGTIRRYVKAWSSNTATLLNPLPSIPATGATVTLVAGCDKTVSTCNSKFSNKIRFRGFPYIPSPENAI